MPTTVNGLGAPISRLPAKPSFDLESAALLDEDRKNMRASVIAELMMPVPAGGGLTLNRIVSNLRERVDKSCEKIYHKGKPAPETISANYVHIHSWLGYKGDIFQELPRGTMSPEDTHLASVLHRYKHDASRGSPISPEYEAYYKAHKAAEIAFKKKTTLVNRYIEEFQNTQPSRSGKIGPCSAGPQRLADGCCSRLAGCLGAGFRHNNDKRDDGCFGGKQLDCCRAKGGWCVVLRAVRTEAANDDDSEEESCRCWWHLGF